MLEIHTQSFSSLYRHFESDDSAKHASACIRLMRAGQDVAGAIRAHVLADDWHDFAFLALRTHFQATRGHIYLATGGQHGGLIKLGKQVVHPRLG